MSVAVLVVEVPYTGIAAANLRVSSPWTSAAAFREMVSSRTLRRVLKAAAGATEPDGHNVMKMFFKCLGDSLQISEDVIKVAAENTENGTRAL